MRPKRCAFRDSHGEANEILAPLIGHTASWARCCPRRRMSVIPDKKRSTAVSIIPDSFSEAKPTGRGLQLWLGPPKGRDRVGNSSALPWLRSYSEGNLFTALKEKLSKQVWRIPRILWKYFIWLAMNMDVLFSLSCELNLITCQHRFRESYCFLSKHILGGIMHCVLCSTLLFFCHNLEDIGNTSDDHIHYNISHFGRGKRKNYVLWNCQQYTASTAVHYRAQMENEITLAQLIKGQTILGIIIILDNYTRQY